MSYSSATANAQKEFRTQYKLHFGLQLISCGEMHCINEALFENMGGETDARIFFVLSGKGAIHRKKEMQSIQEGRAFVVRPGERKQFRTILLEPWHLVWMDISGALCEPLLEALGFTGDIPVIRIEQTIMHMAQQTAERVNRVGTGTLAQELQRAGIFLDFMSWMDYSHSTISYEEREGPPEEDDMDEGGEGYRHVKYLEHYFRVNYQKRIRMSDLAKDMGITPYYMCHIFQKYRGMSPTKCLADIRITRAMKLLEETDKSIGKIAVECGYSNALNFSKLFSRANGCSPSAYRKMQKEAALNGK